MPETVNRPAAVAGRLVPRPGDVIASRPPAREDCYALSVTPGPTQAVAGGYDQALEMVRRVAQLNAVDGWYTCNHIHFLRIVNCRSKENS